MFFLAPVSIQPALARRAFTRRRTPAAHHRKGQTMKVMVFIKANADTEAGVMPSEQMLSEMTTYNEELVKAGIILGGDGLKPSSFGKRVLFSGKDRKVVDGPFAETKELVAGFWMWEVKSMDEAVEWARRIPNPTGEESVVELRPVFSAEDFGEAFTPELQERHAALAAAEKKNASS
jgi:hypothetical protein